MLFSYKKYIKLLFLSLGTVLLVSIIYSMYYIQNCPLPVTNRISLDAKLKFIKEKIDKRQIDTIIVGSSIGLNNVNGEVLAKECKACKHVLNLSVYEASALEVEDVLKLTKLFPNLKRVIYSVQFPDFAEASRFANFDPDIIKKYLDNDFTPLSKATFLFHMCQNIFFCVKREWDFLHKHSRNNQFGYLGFDSTGSVPLHIYGKDIIKSRWEQPHWTKQSPENYQALSRIVKRLKENNIKFYFVVQPYRKPMLDKYPQLRKALASFASKTKNIVQKSNGYFLNLNETLPLDDGFYADRTHLNDKGSIIVTKVIAESINDRQ